MKGVMGEENDEGYSRLNYKRRFGAILFRVNIA